LKSTRLNVVSHVESIPVAPPCGRAGVPNVRVAGPMSITVARRRRRDAHARTTGGTYGSTGTALLVASSVRKRTISTERDHHSCVRIVRNRRVRQAYTRSRRQLGTYLPIRRRARLDSKRSFEHFPVKYASITLNT